MDRDAGALAELRGVEPVVVDLRDPAAIAALPDRIGAADVLANVAGYVHAGTILDCDEDDWALSFDLSLHAAYRMIRASCPECWRPAADLSST